MTDLLAWDSEFFHRRIGSGGPDPLQADRDGLKENLDCLYLYTNFDYIGQAADLGFRLMDVRVTLARSTQLTANTLRSPTKRDVTDMAALTRSAFTDSRFRRDLNFDQDRVDDFYEQWLLASCDGWAQCVKIAERGDRAVGFVTIRDAHIDLIAASRSGDGIGSELVIGAVSCAYELGLKEIRVRTQVSNVGAMRLYEHCGFVTEQTSFICHKWYR